MATDTLPASPVPAGPPPEPAWPSAPAAGAFLPADAPHRPPWEEPGVERATSPAVATGPRAGGRGRQGAAGIGAALLAVAKYGIVAVKLGKFGPMAISMVLSIGALTLLYGWRFAVGLIALIMVHEMGHVLFARIEGVKASLPIFLGPFGALIRIKQPIKDARQEAVIAIGGPLLGTAGAMVCAILAGWTTGSTQTLLIALTYFGFFLNLFNLTPMLPFDGGRIAGAVSVWLNLAGVVVMGWLVFVTLRTGAGVNPLLVLLFALGCYTTFQRFRRRHELTYLTSVPRRTRALIGASWIALICVTAVGMSMAHQRLIDAGAISGPQSSAATGAYQPQVPGSPLKGPTTREVIQPP